MRIRRWLPAGALAVLAAAAVAGLLWTRERTAAPAQVEGTPDAGARRPRQRLVDMQPLLTARRMAALARSPEEQELARQAIRIADHAVDLALAESIRRIAEEPADPTPEIRALADAKRKAQAALDAAAKRVEELGARIAGARSEEQQRLEDQRELARAQQELAQDDLEAAAERLARAGGDPQALIQKLRTSYEAAQKEAPPAPATVAPAEAPSASLLSRLRAWGAERDRRAKLAGARDEATARAQALTSRMDRVRKRLQQAEAAIAPDAPAAATPAPGATAPTPPAAVPAAPAAPGPGEAKPGDGKQTAVTAVRDAARDRRRLTALGKRLEDQQELAEVYADWIERVDAKVLAALRLVLVTLLELLGVGALALIGCALVDRALPIDPERQTRRATVRMLSRLGVQVACAIAALFVALGTPGQATTILGLAGAGLTVALKDFIVAFFGWFVLMGRNGIRVGDWVEIQGVGGEVAEIGLFHTVLLETGGWADAGHPTGRRVSFVNSFAIERHYFNFTTSGQWMWDELRVVVPPGQDPYPIIDGLQKLVERETDENASLAEQEWKRSATGYRVRTFSAVPGVNVVPSANGVELEARYITRAYERHATRRRLSHAVVELMHGRHDRGPGADAA